MDLEYPAMMHNCTRDLVLWPIDASIVTYNFTLKYQLDDIMAHHKAQLVAIGFTQAHGIIYTRTFFHVVLMNSN